MLINGKKSVFEKFKEVWEASELACVSVKLDLEETVRIDVEPLGYSLESEGQVLGFDRSHLGLELFDLKAGGGYNEKAVQDTVNLTRVCSGEGGCVWSKPAVMSGVLSLFIMNR